jgi:small subunit ribosomal protein S5
VFVIFSTVRNSTVKKKSIQVDRKMLSMMMARRLAATTGMCNYSTSQCVSVSDKVFDPLAAARPPPKSPNFGYHGRYPTTMFTFQHLIKMGRHTKVTPGGRINSFSALILIGNECGAAGLGYGKALSPPDAMQKARRDAYKNVLAIDRFEDRTIAQPELKIKYKATKIHMRSCPRGHGVAAGGLLHLLCDAFGFEDIMVAVYGPRNPHNVVRAFFKAVETQRSQEFLARAAGKVFFNHQGLWRDKPYKYSY